MNDALDRLVAEIGLAAPECERLRLAFGLTCANRVRHLLEDPAVEGCLDGLAAWLSGPADADALQALQARAERLANGHPGSRSIDGCGHAAVSASYAVAKAVAGKALDAARYAAYAMVYAGGGYAAVAERAAFEPELAWQLATLAHLAGCYAPVNTVSTPV